MMIMPLADGGRKASDKPLCLRHAKDRQQLTKRNMFLTILKSKIHRVSVTEANLEYVGSITIDEDLMDAAGICANEKVAVVDNTNGARLETYVIPGQRGSGYICMNGAAAHLIHPGDTIIIMAYALMTPEEARTHKPKVIFPINNKL